MPKKMKVLKKKVSTKKSDGSPGWYRLEFEALGKRIAKSKKTVRGKVRLEIDDIDYESLHDAIEKAAKYESLSESGENNAQILIALLEFSIRKDWALKAIPEKGVMVKHYREAVLRLGVALPQRGKRASRDPKRIMDCWESVKAKMPYGKG